MGRIIIMLDNGVELMFRPSLAQGLEHATPAELTTIEISPNGTGLHWPALDADLYVPGLLVGALGSKCWMEAPRTTADDRTAGGMTAAGSRAAGRARGRSAKIAAG
jgi:hypothetical protein